MAALAALLAVAGSVAFASPASANGVDGGRVLPVGAAPDAGSLSGRTINNPVLGIAPTASGNGYWLVSVDGGIFSFGDAPFFGSMGGQFLARPMLGMAATPSGLGYWMFASDGGIFAYGDAGFFGSTGAIRLNAPIVGMTPTATGQGYWLVASDGGVFSFGDARFLGSLGAQPPSSPIVAMATLRTGTGYWVVTADGRVFPFGEARSFGDLGERRLSNPVVGMAATPSGNGYWLAQQDGQVWAFGDASTALATGPRCTDQPIVGLAARPQGDGLWLVTAPAPGPVTRGLAPLAQLDAEHADLVGDLRRLQACQSAASPSSIRWANPLPGSSITSVYGQRIHPVYRVPQFHRGIDLVGGGTTIRAAAPGTVVQVTSRVGYGLTVVVDHGGQLATVYAHLSRATVREGDRVGAGQQLGVMGATGFATGPHLHFEIRSRGEVVDPGPLTGIPRRAGGGSATS